MNRVTKEDVRDAFKGLDDVTVSEIIATEATVSELAEAQAWLVNDEPLLNAGRPLATGRVRELIDILAEFDPNEDDGLEAAPVAREA
jgi:hypothetical protein